jgi:hypothetical protein
MKTYNLGEVEEKYPGAIQKWLDFHVGEYTTLALLQSVFKDDGYILTAKFNSRYLENRGENNITYKWHAVDRMWNVFFRE